MIEKLIDKNTSQEKERQKAKKHNKESLTQLSSSKNRKKTLQEELWRQKHHRHPAIGAAQLVLESQRNSVPEPQKNLYPTTAYYKKIKTKVKTKRRFQVQGNKKTTHRRIRGTSSSSSSSVSTKATIAPAEKMTKVLGQR